MAFWNRKKRKVSNPRGLPKFPQTPAYVSPPLRRIDDDTEYWNSAAAVAAQIATQDTVDSRVEERSIPDGPAPDSYESTYSPSYDSSPSSSDYGSSSYDSGSSSSDSGSSGGCGGGG